MMQKDKKNQEYNNYNNNNYKIIYQIFKIIHNMVIFQINSNF